MYFSRINNEEQNSIKKADGKFELCKLTKEKKQSIFN